MIRCFTRVRNLTVNNSAGDVLAEADDLSYVISNHINIMLIAPSNYCYSVYKTRAYSNRISKFQCYNRFLNPNYSLKVRTSLLIL